VKILFDTNVLIAAFIVRGVCSDLLEHGIQQHLLVTSEFILNEFREKLTGKFKFSAEEAEAAVGLLLSRMVVVKPVDLDTAVCRDRDDDNVLAAAIAGNCDCIVTGDKDLLALQRFGDIAILSPADFWKYEATR